MSTDKRTVTLITHIHQKLISVFRQIFRLQTVLQPRNYIQTAYPKTFRHFLSSFTEY